MSTSSAKRFEKANARQQARNTRKWANREITPERIAEIHVMPDGKELIELKPVSIPGYTYAF